MTRNLEKKGDAGIKTGRSFRLSFNGLNLVFLLFGCLILAFIAVPILKMILAANPSILFDSLRDSVVAKSIVLTLYAALIATVIGFAL